MKITNTNLIFLIKECIREIINEIEDKDDQFKNDPEDSEIPLDPDVNTKPYDDDDIWPGSDIAGIKQHGTGMPHGHGHANWTPHRKERLSKEDIRDILNIKNINGVSEKTIEEKNKLFQEATYKFIQKNMPWVFNYNFFSELTKEVKYPLHDYFTNNHGFIYWLDNFGHQIREILGFQKHWKEFPIEKLKQQAKYNRHWIHRFKDARRIYKEHPTFEKDLESLLEFLNKLYDYTAENPKNPENYPLYVTFYDITQRLGGHEEGGWWYDSGDVIDSTKVNSYKQMRQVVIRYLRMINQADLNGKPSIELETESGMKANLPPPEYS